MSHTALSDFDEGLPTTLPSQIRYESMVKATANQSSAASPMRASGGQVDPWAALRSSSSSSSSQPTYSSSPSRTTVDTAWDTRGDAVVVRKAVKPSPSPMKAPIAPAVQGLFAQAQAPQQQVAPSVQHLFAAAGAPQMGPQGPQGANMQQFFAQAAAMQQAYAHPSAPQQQWPDLAQAQQQAALRAQAAQAAHMAALHQQRPQPQMAAETSQERRGEERRRPRWRKDKAFLTADDMEQLVRMSEYQLQCDNPYLEDFYYQNFMKRRAPERSSKTLLLRHRPIHEVLRPAGTIKKRQGENPFQGALGRIPGHSVRSTFQPRPTSVTTPYHVRFVPLVLWLRCNVSPTSNPSRSLVTPPLPLRRRQRRGQMRMTRRRPEPWSP